MTEYPQKSNKVYVTGIGIISAAGNNADENFANMISGKRNFKPGPTIFTSEFNKPVFECDSSLLDASLLPKRRTLALCLTALSEAINDADLQIEDLREMKVGICLGTTVACTLNDLEFYSQVRSGETPDILPLKRYFCSDISLEARNLLELKGPNLTVVNACSSGTNAIAVAFSWIKSGECDLVIAGGADELNLIPYCGFNSLQVMSDEPCLPFDGRRKGLSLGEGAGILILESSKIAEKRGANLNIELCACGGGSDAFHITSPHPEGPGLKAAISQSLVESGMTPEQIDYINAHGTATENNDKVESVVIADIFGKDAPFSSTKFFTGHTLGAAGAIEAAICVKGILEGCFPGMVDLKQGTDIAISPAIGKIKYNGGGVLSTSMAFGGSCSVLLFAKNHSRSKIENTYPKRPVSLKAKPLADSLEHVREIIDAKPCFAEDIMLRCISTGVIGPFGLGQKAFKDALYDSFSIGIDIREMQISQIPEDVLKDPRLKQVRRGADRLSLAMLLAALEATEHAAKENGGDWQKGKNTALISVTPFGAYKTTFKFLDGLIDYGQLAPSPTDFSNSVHNAPAFYITGRLNITGPSVTFSGFNHPFMQAIKVAEIMLKKQECDQVLLVVGDEICDEMIKMSKLWYTEFNDNIPKMWGEGAVAFILTSVSGGDYPYFKFAKYAEADLTEKIIGKTMINEAFASAAEMIR